MKQLTEQEKQELIDYANCVLAMSSKGNPPKTDALFRIALGAIQAEPAPAIPEGFKLVRLHPTPKQWAAGMKAFNEDDINKIDTVYKAMVAAAPEPPSC